MQATNIPAKFPIPFANGAGQSYIRAIPTPSQQGINNGAASLTDGFPPICFVPTTANGIPPAGVDINGILNQITAWNRWQAAGNPIPFDQTFCTAINGYPLNAVLASTSAGVLWLNTVDGNLTNPDSGSAAGWVAIGAGLGGAATGHGRVVLTAASPSQLRLAPRGGNGLSIGGTLVSVSSGGLTVGTTGVYVGGAANQNLANSTAYLLSTAVIAGSLVPRFWPLASYGHMPDTTAGNIGVEVISNGGNPITGDTLVGMVYVNGSGQFSDTDGALYTLSWFNRRRKKSQTFFTANRTTTSLSYVELNAEIRGSFLVWAGETVDVFANGSFENSATSVNAGMTAIGFDGSMSPDAGLQSAQIPYNISGNSAPIVIGSSKGGLSEGLHYATFLGLVQGNTGIWHWTNTLPTGTISSACSLTLELNG